MLTLEEVKDLLAQRYDEIDLCDKLEINTYDLVERFVERIEERFEEFVEEFNESTDYD